MTNKNISICCFERCCLWFSILNCTIESLATFCYAFNIYLPLWCHVVSYTIHSISRNSWVQQQSTKAEPTERTYGMQCVHCTYNVITYYCAHDRRRKEQKHIHKRIKMVTSCDVHNINDVHCIVERRQSKEVRQRPYANSWLFTLFEKNNGMSFVWPRLAKSVHSWFSSFTKEAKEIAKLDRLEATCVRTT